MARNLPLFGHGNVPSLKTNGIPILMLYLRRFGLSPKVHEETTFKPLKYTIKPAKILTTKERKKLALRLQWENTALFGPLLKSGAEKKRLKICPEVENVRKAQGGIDIMTSPEVKNVIGGQFEMENCSELKCRKVLNDEEGNVFNICNDLIDFPMMNPQSLDESRVLYINSYAENDIKHYPSVTRILNETMSEESRTALERWKNSMIQQLGEEGFAQYQANLLKLGRNLHTNIAEFMLGQEERELSILPGNEGHWKSLKSVFPKMKDVTLIERSLHHPFLKYKGVVDCVAVYRNKLLVIDWKTSKKLKSSIYSTFDSPVQVVAYLGALNFDQSWNFQGDSAAIIVAYENGSPAHIHLLDRNMCLKYWKKWLIRLEQFLSKSFL